MFLGMEPLKCEYNLQPQLSILPVFRLSEFSLNDNLVPKLNSSLGFSVNIKVIFLQPLPELSLQRILKS